jgi:hypothetical protein
VNSHVRDVVVGPLRRWHTAFDRSIFCRHAESIPTHRLQYVLALHAMVTSNNIADRENPDVTHMQLAARVREHRQAVEFFLVGIFTDLETARRLPVFLGIFLHGLGVIGSAHLEIKL